MANRTEFEGVQVRSVAKALAILDLLAAAGREMSLAEIASKTGLAKSTLHGLLVTLKSFRYVEQSTFDGTYRLGIRLFEIGSVVASSWDVRRVAAPHIQRLLDEFEETVHLAVLDQDQVLYIDKRETRRSLRIVSQVGARLPAHCSGVGKVLLAHLPTEEVRRIATARGLPRYTGNTITGLRQLEDELERVRSQGYALDNQEIMDGLRCVAAPIRDHTGRVSAAISVSGPVTRIAGDRLGQAVESVTRTAAGISADLGFNAMTDGAANGPEGVLVPTS